MVMHTSPEEQRRQAAPRALGLSLAPDAPPSPSAVAWAVAHAVAVECGRKPDDAEAIATRWATVADCAAGSPARAPGEDPHRPGLPW